MYRPFTIYKRPTRKKKRFIYYVQFYDESGRRITAVSSGKATKTSAEAWAYEQIRLGKVYPHRPGASSAQSPLRTVAQSC